MAKNNRIIKTLKDYIEKGLIDSTREVKSFCLGAGIDSTTLDSGVFVQENKVTLIILGRYYYYYLS